jgi:hypothetical protein
MAGGPGVAGSSPVSPTDAQFELTASEWVGRCHRRPIHGLKPTGWPAGHRSGSLSRRRRPTSAANQS